MKACVKDQGGLSPAASVIWGSWYLAMWNRQYLRTTSGHVAAPRQFSHLRSVLPVVFCTVQVFFKTQPLPAC